MTISMSFVDTKADHNNNISHLLYFDALKDEVHMKRHGMDIEIYTIEQFNKRFIWHDYGRSEQSHTLRGSK